MNIAYLVFAYRNPRLLERVIARLSYNGSTFFIHIDQKSNIQDFSRIMGNNVCFIARRIPVHWGEFSGVRAILLLIRQALESSKCDYFTLLSGAEYPLRSAQYIDNFLEAHKGSEFISMLKLPAPGKPISRLNTLRFESDKPVRRLLWRTLATIGLAQRDYRQHLGELEPYGGITWWTLSRSACEYVLHFTENSPRVVTFFKDTFAPEETFIHTILGNSPLRDRVRGHLLFEDWTDEHPELCGLRKSASRSHGSPSSHFGFLTSPDLLTARLKGRKPSTTSHLPPRMLTCKHISVFERNQKIVLDDLYGRREALFARKFSDCTLELADRLDLMIRRKEGGPALQPLCP